MSESSRMSEGALSGSAAVEHSGATEEMLSGSSAVERSRADEMIGGIVVSEEPTVVIPQVTFAVTKGSITVQFETSESAACEIWGALYDPEEMLLVLWYENAVEHGTAHEHTKTGLAADTSYAIRVKATTDEGASAHMPGLEGYYVVRTADNLGAGGGLKNIFY